MAIAIALLALLVHVVDAPITATISFSQAATCADPRSPARQPSDNLHHHDAICCLATCAGVGSIGVAPTSAFAFTHPVEAVALVFVAAARPTTSTRPDADFSARGPPRPI